MANSNEHDAAAHSALESHALSPDENGKSYDVSRANAERHLLRFWIVMAIMWSMRGSLHTLCLSVTVFHRMLFAGDMWLLYIVVWAQLGLTNGADMLYAVLVHFLYRKGLVLLPWRTVSS